MSGWVKWRLAGLHLEAGAKRFQRFKEIGGFGVFLGVPKLYGV